MKILLTGSTGYVGREFLKLAQAAGHDVTCFGHYLAEPKAIAAIKWSSYDALVHLAAAGVRRTSPTRTWTDCMAVNFGGTRDLLQSLGASGVTPSVFISGTIRESQTGERPDYWSDPYIVSQKLRRSFVIEWERTYLGRVRYPYCERCGDRADVESLCLEILEAIK